MMPVPVGPRSRATTTMLRKLPKAVARPASVLNREFLAKRSDIALLSAGRNVGAHENCRLGGRRADAIAQSDPVEGALIDLHRFVGDTTGIEPFASLGGCRAPPLQGG